MKKQKLILAILVVFIVAFIAQNAMAQCPMCRLSAETNLENGGTAGKGLNAGILYLLSMPYLVVGAIAFLWIRNRRKSGGDEDVDVEY